MLVYQTQVGRLQDPELTYPVDSALCERSGYVAFSKEDFSGPREDNTALPCDVSAIPTIRLFLGELRGFRIPQLALFPVKIGYPLCRPDKTFSYRRSSGKYQGSQKILGRTFIEIPVPFITRSLFSDFTSLPHAYSVAFSPKAAIRRDPYNGRDGRVEFQAKGGSFFTYRTDRNKMLDSNAAWESSFPVLDSKYQSTVDSIIDSNPSMINFAKFIFGAGQTLELLDNKAFGTYLPYWLLQYPLKYKRVKGDTARDTGGQGANEGFPLWVSGDNSNFVPGIARKNVLSVYFNTQRSLLLAPSGAPQLKAGTAPTQIELETSRGLKRVLHATFDYLPAETVIEFARIHRRVGFTEAGKQFNSHFGLAGRPCPSIKAPYDCYISQRTLDKIALIQASRYFLEEKSEVSCVDGEHCAKCFGALRIPKLLEEAGGDTENLVCVECGAKFLLNLVNYVYTKLDPSGEVEMPLFPGYPLQEVIFFSGSTVGV